MLRTTTMRLWRASLTAATMLGGLALPVAAQAQAGTDWTTERGDPQGTGYSNLSEINSSNAGGLVEEFSIPTNTFQNHEGAALSVSALKMMYAVTPWPNYLIAVDENTNAVKWTYDPATDPGSRAQACCDFDNRGPAFASAADGGGADGLIIFNSLDGVMHAVNARSGKLVWKTKLASLQIGETMTGAPIIAKGVAIVGNSGAEDGVRGAVYGVRVSDGTLLWKAYNTGPDADVLIGPKFKAFYASDQGTDLGKTSWNGGNWWQQGGATAWGYKTYDPVNDLVYYGTGNADPWLSFTRGGHGDAKWSASIIARRPETGEAVWATQLSPDDNWDYDSISESIVADIPINGVSRHVLFHADKNGYAYTLDAATGEILVAGNYPAASGSIINWSTGVNLKTGRPKVPATSYINRVGPNAGIQMNCPGAGGAKNNEPAAFSFQTGLFYIPAHNACLSEMAVAANWLVGTPFTAFTTIPGVKVVTPGDKGALVAWNASTGQPSWVNHEPYALWGGVLATAGNLVFYGTLSNGADNPSTPTFKAVDASTGALVWSTNLECNTVGSPSTFIGADGHQRIAMFTGTGSTGNAGTGKCPNLVIYDPVKGKPVKDMSKTSTWLGQELKVPNSAFGNDVTSGYLHVFRLP